eukprot:g2701.t1
MALRRDLRLRKEYLYRKSLEGKEREAYERKMRIREALAEGKPIPTEYRNTVGKDKNEIDLEDAETMKQKTHVDDEYAHAGFVDPKVCVTTARQPSSRLKQFVKEVRLIFPNSQRINRGKTQMGELVEVCKRNDFTDIVMITETRGEPDGMIVSHLPFGPTAYFSLSQCVMRHDIADRGTISEAVPHLIFNNFRSKLGERLSNILKYLFPAHRKDGSQRVITFSNENDFISFRHHTYTKEPPKDVTLTEVGPRFEMKLYRIRLGTVDQTDADDEWVLRNHMNSAKKRDFL